MEEDKPKPTESKVLLEINSQDYDEELVKANAPLQHRILHSLSEQAAASVAALARHLETPRPSVSRAINSLAAKGLVDRNNRSLLLTENGKTELKRLDVDFAFKSEEARATYTHIIERQERLFSSAMRALPILSATDAINKSTFISANALGTQLTTAKFATEGLTGAWDTLGKQINPTFITDLAKSITSSVGAFNQLDPIGFDKIVGSNLLEKFSSSKVFEEITTRSFLASMTTPAVEISSGFVAQQVSEILGDLGKAQFVTSGFSQQMARMDSFAASLGSSVAQMLAENNTALAGVTANLSYITGFAASTSISEMLKAAILDTSSSFNSYYKSVLNAAIVTATSEIPKSEHIENFILIPTQATNQLTNTARYILEAEIAVEPEDEPQPERTNQVTNTHQEYEALIGILENYLKPLGSHYVEMWLGAWDTFYAGGRDRIRQVSHSVRELVNQVILELAPDEVFSEEQRKHGERGKITRAMRTRHIMKSHSAGELAESLAKMVDKLYQVMAGQSHNHEEKPKYDDTELLCLMRAAGNILQFILYRAQPTI